MSWVVTFYRAEYKYKYKATKMVFKDKEQNYKFIICG